MDKNQAAEKIRKLLKRNGRTEAEADTASILAAALAEKHGIDIAALDQQEQQSRSVVTHKVMGEWASIPPEVTYASLICKRFFEVDPFSSRPIFTEQMIFVGTAWHIELAEYVFNFLITEFRWLWNKKRGRCRQRKAFIYGAYRALFVKLAIRFEKPAKGGTELEISFAAGREKYIKENFGKMEESSAAPKKKNSMSAQRGYVHGQNIEIRPGVNDGEQTTTEMLPGLERRLLLTQ